MSRPGRIDWNEENVAKLKSLWDEGRPASYITTEFPGSTRSGILGKIHRLGLKGPRSNDRRPVVKRIPKAARKLAKLIKQPIEYDPFDMPPSIINVDFHSLEPYHCRWPVSGTGTGTLYCGAERIIIGPHSYCAKHDQMAHR